MELRVEDQGPGIPPEILDRIFEPFFTTKDVGKGSGMGLASVHDLVHELGGHIVVEPVTPHGTRFRVLFPAIGGAQNACEGASVCAGSPLCRLEGRVLVGHPELPVILYTGFNEGLEKSATDAAGVQAVLTKPVDPHELFGLLQSRLANSRS